MKQKLLFLFALIIYTLQGFSQATAYPAPDISQCGNEVFNLTQQDNIILGNQTPPQFTIAYFSGFSDAINNVNPITNPSAFIGQEVQEIFARVTNTEDDSYDVEEFLISWSPGVFVQPMPDVTVCDSYFLPPLQSGSYFTGPGGTGSPLSAADAIVSTQTIYVYASVGNCTDEESFTVTVFSSPLAPPMDNVYSCTPYTLPELPASMTYFADLEGTIPITFDVVTISMTVYIMAQSGTVPNCTTMTSFGVFIGGPELMNPTPLSICNNDGSGYGVFDLESKVLEISGGIPGMIVTFHETLIDAQTASNPIASTNNYINIVPNQQTVYVRASLSDGNCDSVLELALIVQACTENTISGTIRFDYDNNGCTANDLPAANFAVACTNGNVVSYAYTNALGNYSFTNVQEGSNTVSLSAITADYTVTPLSYNFAVTGNANANTADFCLSLVNPVHDVFVQIYPNGLARPGFAAAYTLYVYNIGNTIISGTATLAYDNGMLDFVSANPTFASQTANTVTFNYSNLLPLQSQFITLNFIVETPPTVVAGDVLHFTATVTTNLVDVNLENNTHNLNQIVVNSFDPNDITVLEGEVITEEQADGYLTYMIRFQNTGTADAVNINITNELDPKTEWSSFLPLSSSHNYLAERVGAHVTFRFNEIMLPPSSVNELGSHGFVVYRVKPVADFEVGDIIYNTANIFFDFNPPIVTNTVTTQIQPLGVPGNDFSDLRIYPNPASGRIFIQCNGLEDLQVAVYDLQGKLILGGRPEISNNSTTLDVSGLHTGMYVVKLVSGNQSVTKKLVVE